MEMLDRIFKFYGVALIIAFGVIMVVGITRRFLKDCIQKKQCIEAKVVDLYDTSYYKTGGIRTGQRFVTDYVVTFYAGTKTLKFIVSPWMYGSLHKGDQGILTYKGSRLLKFQNQKSS